MLKTMAHFVLAQASQTSLQSLPVGPPLSWGGGSRVQLSQSLGPMETVGPSCGPAPPLRAALGIMPTSRHVSAPFLAKAVETGLCSGGDQTQVSTQSLKD